MANPLNNESELYEQIKNEKITIHPDIWDMLYNRIGDDITFINLLCQYYLNVFEPMPIHEAEKIFSYTRHIKEIVGKIVVVSKDNLAFPVFANDMLLHPIIQDMFTHYIGNDVYMINLIIGDTIDPIDPHPLSADIIQKILAYTRSIKQFMNKLQKATS